MEPCRVGKYLSRPAFDVGRRLIVVSAVLLASAAAPAAAQELGRLKMISAGSPFTGCTADNVGQQDGASYPQTEIEPFIDGNPANPRNLIAVWQQDRWSNGGARGNSGAYTEDGGETWIPTVPPNVSACSGGDYTRASDPWVSISPDGTAFFMHLVFDPDLPNGSFGRNAMLVSRSENGGRSWSNPIALRRDGVGQALNDKNSLTADPTDSDFAYAVWDRLVDFTLPESAAAAARPAALRAQAGAGDGAVAARQRAKALRSMAARGAPATTEVFFKGPMYFTRTTNGGRSWERAREVYDPGGNAQTINNLIEVLPSGIVVDFFTEILPNAGTRIRLIRSLDKGQTFGDPVTATTIATVFGAVTPDTQELVRDASILFDTAVDPHTGNLYLVWQDVRFSGVDEIAFAMSTDGGRNWSQPVRINRTPNNANKLREQAIVPSIEVGPGGALVVTYYDFRFDKLDESEATDHWAIFCDARTVNCRQRTNWRGEKRLTPKSFNMLNAPVAGGYFLGDYMGLARSGREVFPAFGIAHGPNRTSIFTRPIGGLGDLSASASN